VIKTNSRANSLLVNRRSSFVMLAGVSALGATSACSGGDHALVAGMSDGAGTAGAAGTATAAGAGAGDAQTGGAATPGAGASSAGASSGGAPSGGASNGGASNGGASGRAGASGQGASGAGAGGTGFSPATGKLDTWENVTPAGVTLDPDFHGAQQNFGAMGVVADPVRPNELYSFYCYQGVWKSIDFGLSWTKVSTGMNGDKLDGGRPWTAIIDDDPARDAATPPTLYTADGYGPALGIYKSTDGGVNWTIYGAGLDIYSLDMDPYDHLHLITGMHESHDLAESTNGGLDWKTIPTDPANGKSIYPYFMDTGDPLTTRKTWLLIPQIDSGSSTYTTDGGATFKATTGAFSHPHGGNQGFIAAPKIAYAAGSGGVWQTTDAGLSWNKTYSASDPYLYANGIVGTKTSLYSWDTGSNLGGIGGPHLHKAVRSSGTDWAPVTTPAEMSNGPQGMAVTFDGAHYILVGGAVNAGVWRYIEP
jgi:hypothetical protein